MKFSADDFDDFIDFDPHDDSVKKDDNDICPACNGSGEGQYDGSTCSTCKGK